MADEIERKFLLANDAWRGLVQGKLLRQGYLCTENNCAVRVRISADKAWLGVKGKTVGATRPEFEYAIPLEDAERLLNELARRPLIEKTRYAISASGLVWEVDEFHGVNQGLLVVEVELKNEGQKFEKPIWVGREVTGDPRYYNANLVARPFSDW